MLPGENPRDRLLRAAEEKGHMEAPSHRQGEPRHIKECVDGYRRLGCAESGRSHHRILACSRRRDAADCNCKAVRRGLSAGVGAHSGWRDPWFPRQNIECSLSPAADRARGSVDRDEAGEGEPRGDLRHTCLARRAAGMDACCTFSCFAGYNGFSTSGRHVHPQTETARAARETRLSITPRRAGCDAGSQREVGLLK